MFYSKIVSHDRKLACNPLSGDFGGTWAIGYAKTGCYCFTLHRCLLPTKAIESERGAETVAQRLFALSCYVHELLGFDTQLSLRN